MDGPFGNPFNEKQQRKIKEWDNVFLAQTKEDIKENIAEIEKNEKKKFFRLLHFH